VYSPSPSWTPKVEVLSPPISRRDTMTTPTCLTSFDHAGQIRSIGPVGKSLNVRLCHAHRCPAAVSITVVAGSDVHQEPQR